MAFREPSSERIQFARSQRRMSSRCEEALWRELRGRRLAGFKFRRQAPIGRYVADFYCNTGRVVVEADGPAHACDEQRAHDRLRDSWFANRGYRVLRFTEDEILGDLQGVLDRIERALVRAPKA